MPKSREEILSEYVSQGRILKQVSEDIQPHLEGVLDGLAAEVVDENTVIIYKLNREKGGKGLPFLLWSSEKVIEKSSKKGLLLEYVIPEGRSKGLLVSKTNRICVPLLA